MLLVVGQLIALSARKSDNPFLSPAQLLHCAIYVYGLPRRRPVNCRVSSGSAVAPWMCGLLTEWQRGWHANKAVSFNCI
jgi:hypothetical protein